MITKKQFKKATGYEPKDDDMERVNCVRIGDVGHISCGWCNNHKKPRFVCGCITTKEKK